MAPSRVFRRLNAQKVPQSPDPQISFIDPSACEVSKEEVGDQLAYLLRSGAFAQILAVGNNPDGHDAGLTTVRPAKGRTDTDLETEPAGLARHAVAGSSQLKQGIAKAPPAIGEKPHALKSTI